MFRHAFIQQLGNNRLRVEERLVLDECQRQGIETSLYLAKHIQRRQIPLDHDSFICGDMDAMHGAMKMLGIEPPVVDDYPLALEPFFHRRVWRSSMAQLENRLDSGEEVFVKPAGRRKLFTGRVFAAPSDLYHLSGVSRQEPLWCSDVVDWLAEYRVYVVEHQPLIVAHYAGDDRQSLDMQTVHAALKAYSSTAPAAYGIDFGVLESGQTALVEANDGYALGAYQIDAAPYAKLLFSRWSELLASAVSRGSMKDDN
jgi:hypothetical protein